MHTACLMGRSAGCDHQMFLNDGGQAISVYDAESGRHPSDVGAVLLEHLRKTEQ